MAQKLLEVLSSLASDPVPGIRIAVARGILELPAWTRDSHFIQEAATALDQDPIIKRVTGDLLPAMEGNSASPSPPPPPPPSASPPALAPPSASNDQRKEVATLSSSSSAAAANTANPPHDPPESSEGGPG